jgi:Ser/Thr protein kinase RdoA (MazF antagonist)
MEERIRDRYNQDIYEQALKRYGISEGRIQLLDGFESFIYEFERSDGEFILRVAHSLRRTPNLIRGEVDWINYLVLGGTSVPLAVPSQDGELVEEIDDAQDGYFLVTAFEKAKGIPPWEMGWSDELYVTYGKLIGRIHALSEKYEPADHTWRRPEWDDPINVDVVRHLSSGDHLIAEKFDRLMTYLKSLPKDSQSYGLIHQDAHGGNLFVDEAGKITLFDFDDCVYSWFIYDIAMVLFYIAMGADDVQKFTKNFMHHFLSGYTQEKELDPVWLLELPYFLKLREIDLYAVIHRSFDVENLDDPWCLRYMQGRKEKIENDVPFIDYDFGQLAV